MKSDPYQTFRNTAQALENEGVDVDTITDALVSVGLGAADRLSSPQHVIAYLHRLIAFYEARAEGGAQPPKMKQ